MKRTSGFTPARFLQALGLALFYLWLVIDPRASGEAARSALRLCAGTLLPSLFPFFVCSGLLCRLCLLAPCERALRKIMRPLFGVPGAGAGALVLGLTGGYPAGAQAVASFYEAREIDRDDAARLVSFCNNCGPAFIFGVAAQSVLKSSLAGFLLYLAQILSALLCGVLLAPPRAPGQEKAHITHNDLESTPSFAAAFSLSVQAAGQSALSVCMFVVFFAVLSSLARAALSPFVPDTVLTFLCGLLELSGGMQALGAASFSQGAKFILASFFLAFGGVSVLAQSKAVLQKAGLENIPLLGPKLLQGTLAALFAALFYALFGARFAAVPALSQGAISISQSLWCFTLPCALFLIFRKMAGSIFSPHRV